MWVSSRVGLLSLVYRALAPSNIACEFVDPDPTLQREASFLGHGVLRPSMAAFL